MLSICIWQNTWTNVYGMTSAQEWASKTCSYMYLSTWSLKIPSVCIEIFAPFIGTVMKVFEFEMDVFSYPVVIDASL